MAKITFTQDEIQKILKSYSSMVKFDGFENDKAIFKVTSWIPAFISKIKVVSLLQESKLGKHVDLKDYPKVAIDLKTLVAEKVKGVEIKDVAYSDGLFTITT